MKFKGTRIVYIRDPERNYQFVAIAQANYSVLSKGLVGDIPISFDLTEGSFKRITHRYPLSDWRDDQ